MTTFTGTYQPKLLHGLKDPTLVSHCSQFSMMGMQKLGNQRKRNQRVIGNIPKLVPQKDVLPYNVGCQREAHHKQESQRNGRQLSYHGINDGSQMLQMATQSQHNA
jgi:hypothetical protein